MPSRKEYHRRYGAEHKERIRDQKRKHSLSVGGKHIKVLKRDYPADGECELCGKVNKLLQYHHWDDECLEFGLWLCITCHKIAEALEHGVAIKYNQLKEKASKEAALEKVAALGIEALNYDELEPKKYFWLIPTWLQEFEKEAS